MVKMQVVEELVNENEMKIFDIKDIMNEKKKDHLRKEKNGLWGGEGILRENCENESIHEASPRRIIEFTTQIGVQVERPSKD